MSCLCIYVILNRADICVRTLNACNILILSLNARQGEYGPDRGFEEVDFLIQGPDEDGVYMVLRSRNVIP